MINLETLGGLASSYSHFCYVTDDIDKSIKIFALMGVQGLQKTVSEGSAEHPHRMLWALGEMGTGSKVELVQPLTTGNTYSDFYERNKGPGLHHVGFIGVPNFDEVYDTLVSQGCIVVQEHHTTFKGRELHMAYIDCAAIGMPMIELAGKSQKPV